MSTTIVYETAGSAIKQQNTHMSATTVYETAGSAINKKTIRFDPSKKIRGA